MKALKILLAILIVCSACSDDPEPIDGTYTATFRPEFPGTPPSWEYDITLQILTIGQDSVNCIVDARLDKGSTISQLDWEQSQGRRTNQHMLIVFGTLEFNTQNLELDHQSGILSGDYYRQYQDGPTTETVRIADNIKFEKVK